MGAARSFWCRVAEPEGGQGLAWGGGSAGLLARRFACERDARRALEEASRGLAYHRRVYLGVREERRREKVGRPRKGESPLGVGYRLLARVERDVERGDGPGAVGVRLGGVGATAEA